MSQIRKNNIQKQRRAARVRWQLHRNSELPRVSVFRSSKHIYAQVIDNSATHASCSTLELTGLTGDKKSHARQVGLELAKRSLEKGIKQVCFDRGQFLYHGRVKELAEGLREGGLKV